MICGGTMEDYENKRDDCYIMRVNRNCSSNSVTISMGPALPIPEGFWSHQTERVDDKIFMLQNVAHNEDPNCVLLDRRRVVMYDVVAYAWHILD